MSCATLRSRRMRSCGGVARHFGNAAAAAAIARSTSCGAGLRERAEQPLAIDGTALVARRRRVDVGAVDVQRVSAAELRAHLAHRSVEARMHLGRRIEHRRIRQLVAHSFISPEQCIQQRQSVLQLLFLDHQRRRENDQIPARRERNVARQRILHQLHERRMRIGPRAQRRLRCAIAHQLDDCEQAVTAAHVADDRMPLLQLLQLAHTTARPSGASARSGPRSRTPRWRRRPPRTTADVRNKSAPCTASRSRACARSRADITTAPSGRCAPVSPFASVIRSGRPSSP